MSYAAFAYEETYLDRSGRTRRVIEKEVYAMWEKVIIYESLIILKATYNLKASFECDALYICKIMEKNKILKYKWLKDYLVDDVSSSEKENSLEN